jgi:ATP-dependent RNA helicase DDX55/SPB4
LDPPSDPKTFIHRCGRAGRAGRRGLAVTLLTPGSEEDYIEFLQVRQTPISPLTSIQVNVTPQEAEATTEKIRKLVREDRALFDKAQRGFVSWVRAYSKHTASSIFRTADLDWKELGDGWGLLTLPAMPEVKKWEGDRRLGQDLDLATFAYKDKAREKQRLEELELVKLEGAKKRQHKKEDREKNAWTEQKESRATKELRREKKKAKREHERVSKLTDEERKEEERLQAMIEDVRKNITKQEAEDKANEFDGFSD